jgi:hypothetical protein
LPFRLDVSDLVTPGGDPVPQLADRGSAPPALGRILPHRLHICCRKLSCRYPSPNVRRKAAGLLQPKLGGPIVRLFIFNSNFKAKAEGVDIRVVGERPLSGKGRVGNVVVVERLDEIDTLSFA